MCQLRNVSSDTQEDVGDCNCSGSVVLSSGTSHWVKRRSSISIYTITQFLRVQLLLQSRLNDHCSDDDLLPVLP